MEHRYTARKNVKLGVVVSLPRLGLVRGYTNDISLGGMFIETDCVAMPVNALVTVNFQPEGHSPLVCFQAKAMVVHQRAGGFGLMFDELEPTCVRALRRLLSEDEAVTRQDDAGISEEPYEAPLPQEIRKRAAG